MNRLRHVLTTVLVVGCLHSAIVPRLLNGFSLGLLLLVAISQLRLTFGGTTDVDVALLGAACLAGSLWGLVRGRLPDPNWGWLLVGTWGLAAPWFLDAVLPFVSAVSVETLASPRMQLFLAVASAVVWVTPLAFGGLLACGTQRCPGDGPPAIDTPPWGLWGIALCWLIVPGTLALWMSLSLLAWTAVGVMSLTLFGEQILRGRMSSASATEAATSFPAPAPMTEAGNQPESPFARLVFPGGLCLMAGAALGIVLLTARQLIFQTLITDFALAAGLCLGIACGGLTFRNRVVSHPPVMLLPMMLAAFLTLVTAAYPIWTMVSLWTSAWISQPWMLLTVRGLLFSTLTLPIGYVVGRTWSWTGDVSAKQLRSTAVVLPCGLLLGHVFSINSGLSVGTLTVLLILSGVTLSLTVWIREGSSLPQGLFRRFAWGGLCGTALAGLFLTGNFSLQNSERLLFSSNTFASYRNGVPRHQLPWLDDNRPLAEFGTLGNRWSVSKYRGAQVLTRHNGIYTEIRSTDVSICPHAAGEVLPALLPLALHPRAEHVLVLGLHTATLETCHAHPLLSVTTLEDDPVATEMLRWLLDERLAPAAFVDAKFRYLSASPTLGVAARHPHRYDVIIAPRCSPVTIHGTVQLTRNFYEHVFAQLSAGGLFCQRIPYYDLGPAAIQEIAATLQSVFPYVMMTESVPGELLFVASQSTPEEPPLHLLDLSEEEHHPSENPTPSLIDLELVNRLQLPQCRRVLGQAGWDWSLVMGRAVVDHADLSSLTLGISGNGRGNRPHLAFRLPLEVAGWGPKFAQTRQLLTNHAKSLAGQLGNTAEVKEISERLDDLRLADQVLREHPDRPWTYRAVLKKQLSERPRAKIIQVRGEGLKHGRDPEDQRRKEYLEALGNAATQEHPRLEDIAAVAAYDAPFDPLLTHFVHHEVSLLLSRAAKRYPRLELQHRLNTVYFASTQDSSVRNVCQTIDLLCGEPDACPLGMQRWDHLNGLLEVMRHRWTIRNERMKERSKYEPIDTEHSIKSVERALAVMDSLRTESGLSDREWEIRRTVLEESLLQPLRKQRSVQLRQYTVAPSPSQSPAP